VGGANGAPSFPPLPSLGAPPSPFTTPPHSSPFAPRQSPPTPSSPGPSPFNTGAPPSPFASPPPARPVAPPPAAPSFALAPPQAAFVPSMPPPPDEIVVDTDLAFSLEGFAMDPGVGSGKGPPGFPMPPAVPQKGSSIDSIFDGVDIQVPRSPPQAVTDNALDAFGLGAAGAGDFFPPPATAPPPAAPALGLQPAPPPRPPSDDEWAPAAFGADLVAAFNAAEEEQAAVAAPEPLDARLRAVAERLRREGRSEDADVVTEACAALQFRD
jgi:Wiskott-Aldrich syndrome protein